jgi:hypothetical protein
VGQLDHVWQENCIPLSHDYRPPNRLPVVCLLGRLFLTWRNFRDTQRLNQSTCPAFYMSSTACSMKCSMQTSDCSVTGSCPASATSYVLLEPVSNPIVRPHARPSPTFQIEGAWSVGRCSHACSNHRVIILTGHVLTCLGIVDADVPEFLVSKTPFGIWRVRLISLPIRQIVNEFLKLTRFHYQQLHLVFCLATVKRIRRFSKEDNCQWFVWDFSFRSKIEQEYLNNLIEINRSIWKFW